MFPRHYSDQGVEVTFLRKLNEWYSFHTSSRGHGEFSIPRGATTMNPGSTEPGFFYLSPSDGNGSGNQR